MDNQPSNTSTPKELLDRILASTYSMTDAIRRLRSVKQFLINQLFASAISEFSADTQADTAWLSGLGADFFKNFNQNNVYQLIEEIDKELKKVQPLVIYLPFEMPAGEVVRVGLYLRKTFGPTFLVDIKIDPNLIAGCALAWNNSYKDYSLRVKISENKLKILEIIKSYVKRMPTESIQTYAK